MRAKKSGKHLLFYNECMNNNGIMPFREGVVKGGLCLMAEANEIDPGLLELFSHGQPMFGYWADPYSKDTYETRFVFNELRQTIVLFMAAINGEL